MSAKKQLTSPPLQRPTPHPLTFSQILDREPALHFALLRLQLLELIRACTAAPDGDVTPALTFATTQLAPRAPLDPAFIHDLEQTMALLIFPPGQFPATLARQLDPALRVDVAERVNRAMLKAGGERTGSRLCDLIKTRFWAERMNRDEKRDLPEKIDLGLEGAREEGERGAGEDSVMQENGNGEAMKA